MLSYTEFKELPDEFASDYYENLTEQIYALRDLLCEREDEITLLDESHSKRLRIARRVLERHTHAETIRAKNLTIEDLISRDVVFPKRLDEK